MKRVVIIASIFLLTGGLMAANKPAPSRGKLVDSGSFSIFVNGRRIGTEQFRIEQLQNGSVVNSEVTIEDGSSRAMQASELEMGKTGNLIRYHWHEESPGKAQSTVEPSNEFLVQHISQNGTDKAQEQPYILPPSTMVVDDYFFIHREVLAWRYLASVCESSATGLKCKTNRGDFGILIPRQRTSMPATIAFAGKETINIHGTMRELYHFTLKTEVADMSLYLDQQNKLIRAVIEGDQTEAIRD